MMKMRRKSMWQRLVPGSLQVSAKEVAKSGLTAVVTAVGLTAVSAAVSGIRKRDEEQ